MCDFDLPSGKPLRLKLGCRLSAMQHEFREGDWVRHCSYPEPLRVIGIGTTIAVQFPSGVMQAFEPSELVKVPIAQVPVQKVHVREYRQHHGRSFVEEFVLVSSISLICWIMLVWLIAGALL